MSRWLPLLALLLLLPLSRATAHQQLLRASPTDGAVLTSLPTEIRLTFNQAVEPALAQLQLSGPAGVVALAPHYVPADAPTVLVGSIRGALRAGEYVVEWLVTGDDGHPVRGEIRFTIAADATGLLGDSVAAAAGAVAAPTAPGRDTPPAEHQPTRAMGDGFGAGSPLYGAVRWLTFVGLVTVIGTVSFALLLVPTMLRRGGSPDPSASSRALARSATLGVAAAGVLAVAVGLRLIAQSAALHGPADTPTGELMVAMLTRTVWGWGWIVQASATVLVLLALLLARRGRREGWPLAAIGCVALAVTPALSGHAAATSTLAVVTDALHVLAAGGWLGTLLVLLVIGVPTLLARAGSRREDAASLLGAFSSLALVFASILILTGVYAAWLHLPTVTALWGSRYGQTLLLKLAALLLVFAAGAYNWRRARPALENRDDAGPLKRSATAELAMGAVVLAVTAALVATPPPSEDPAMAERQESGGTSFDLAPENGSMP